MPALEGNVWERGDARLHRARSRFQRLAGCDYGVCADCWSGEHNPGDGFEGIEPGPDLVLWNFSHFWVYIVGPIAGALVAVGFAYILRGRGGDVSGIHAAQGRLEEIAIQTTHQK